MRKGKEQQKNRQDKQLELFDIEGQPVCNGKDGILTKAISGAELSSRLDQKRTLTQNILERIVDYGNLDKAYRQVASNKGVSGVDKISITELRGWLSKHVVEFQDSLLEGKYEVSPVQKVEIPKPDGGVRLLGIPTTKDRLVQQAIHQQLNLYYEPYFSENSYGFRAGRNAQQAIRQASHYVKEGKEWVVDIDLENFFDKINHDRLMQRLSKGVGDKRLLRLINACLKSGIMAGGFIEQRIAGTPQGSPLSPLLSNIILDELDNEIEKRGLAFCRYADDCNIYVSSQKAGERVLKSITTFIETKLKLKVNREKSGVRHCSKVKFLGYTVMEEGKIRVADKSIRRFKTKVKEITKRNRGVRFEQVIIELNRFVIGWSNYFVLANCYLTVFRDLDGWIRRKLRCYRLKQCGRRYTTYKFLRSLGIAENLSWNVVMYSQGWWVMSNKVAVNHGMNNLWFSQLGLQSLQLRMCRGS
jgi:RNA-directed DNA polymerase